MMENMKLQFIHHVVMQLKEYNHQITAVDMHKENLDGDSLIRYPLIKGEHINYQN